MKTINNIISQFNLNENDVKKIINKYCDSTDIQNIDQDPTFLCSRTIKKISPSGITIDKSGNYLFSNNIAWNGNNNTSAITITANNVTLDLKNHTLINTNINKTNVTIGITVIGANNITIKNGTIKNMSYKGISINTCSNPMISNIIIDTLFLENLITRFITPSGIFIQSSTNIDLQKCLIKNINVKTDSSAGIQLLNCLNGTITDCNVKNMQNQDGAIQGYSYVVCTNIVTKNSNSCCFQSFFNGNIETSGHTVLGFVCIVCDGLTYMDCSAKNMIGCCDDVHGMSIFVNINVNICNFNAKKIIGGVMPYNTCAKATGIEVYGSNVTIKNSKANEIYAINPQDKQSTGFSCAGGSNIQFVQCIASNVYVLNDQMKKDISKGNGTGFGWAPDPRPIFRLPVTNVSHKKCIAKNCQIGFDSWFHIDSLWKNIISCNCTIGLLDDSTEKRTISCNACSECIPDITITLDNVANNNTFEDVENFCKCK